jgi:predicted phage tail protein
MSESKEDMQNQLNVFNDFCKKWKLKVNTEKSKVLVAALNDPDFENVIPR